MLALYVLVAESVDGEAMVEVGVAQPRREADGGGQGEQLRTLNFMSMIVYLMLQCTGEGDRGWWECGSDIMGPLVVHWLMRWVATTWRMQAI